MPTRRSLLKGLAASGAIASLPTPTFAANWGVNASSVGLRPGSVDNQGRLLQNILEKASLNRQPVFLEPGKYRVSNLNLPEHTVINGVPGATVLEYAGGNHFVFGENLKQVSLAGLKFDGGLLPVGEYADASLRINDANRLHIGNCHFTNSAASGVEITRSAGVFKGNHIDSAVGSAGFFGHENTGLLVDSNTVEECANGGILIHRWRQGADNTIVTNNRVRKIAAINGGTGQWGNGINTYLADGIIIEGNHVSDCAFSTIRSNSCNNIQISDNTCLRAGESSIYSEFAFQGAKITGNIVDGGVTGISIANFNEGGRLSVCANNIVRNIHDNLPYKNDGHIQGIGISVEADTTLTGNVIENAINFGLMLGWGPYLRNVTANSNVVRSTRTGMYVSVVEGIGAVNITNNIFSRISEAGIIGHRWHDAVTGDMAIQDNRRFPSLKISGNSLDS
ncbi:MAG: TIGR03808 family TAT-translocated repetitive protein [Pseudomonadota bacterium]